MAEVNKYQRSRIYKIVSDQTEKFYIGSTTEKYLSNRLNKHRANFKEYQQGKFRYVTSFEILQYPDHRIVLLETYPCETREELLAREEDYLEHYKDSIVNKFKAWTGLDKNEYDKQRYDDNREQILQQKKQYKENNKERITCECGGSFLKYLSSTHRKTKMHQNYLANLEQ